MSGISATLRRRLGLATLLIAAAVGLGGVAAQGLTPVEHAWIAMALGVPDEEAGALSDVALMERLTVHATTGLGLRVRPGSIDRLWAI